MKKWIPILIIGVAFLTGCPKTEQDARDTAAALNGAIVAAQAKYQSQCASDPRMSVCQTINQAVAGQNALITATESYCGWSQTMVPPVGTKCVPVKSAEAGLITATQNAALFITELRAVIQ